MRNKNKAVWGTRFNKSTSKIFEKIGASIDVDKRLFEEDISASIVHTQMLVNQKIINKKIGHKIMNGLKRINNEIKKNKFNFSKKHEDIHLNIEKRLFEIIGESAGYLHIARSRNDQVATDFKMWIKEANSESRKVNWKFLSNYKNSISNIKLNINLYYKFSNKIPLNFNWYSIEKNKEFIPTFTKKIFKQVSILF